MSIEAMKLALEFIDANADGADERDIALALRQAIEQIQKQEPVVNYCRECLTYNGHQEGCSHYTSPPKRAPLTDEEIDNAVWHLGFGQLSTREVARAIEAAHGIKGKA